MGFRLSAGERCLSGRLFFLDGGHFSRWVLAALCTVVSVLKALTSHLSADGRPAHTDRLGSAGKAHSRLTAGRAPRAVGRSRPGRAGGAVVQGRGCWQSGQVAAEQWVAVGQASWEDRGRERAVL